MRIPHGLNQGDLVVARNRKWDGRAHWVVPGRYLGEDEHGWWIFQGTNEFCARPGAAFYTASDAVLLVPRTGEFVVTFYDDTYPGDFRVYVDLATAHEWRNLEPGVAEFHVIDMDLDVIRSADNGVFVDDEDEFAEHGIEMAYPVQLVDRIRSASDELYQAVKAQQPPFDGTDREWFRKGRA